MVPKIIEVRSPGRRRALAQLSPLATDANRGGFSRASRSSRGLDLTSAIGSSAVTEVHSGDPEFFRKLASCAALSEEHAAADGAGKRQQNGATTDVPCLTVAAWLTRNIPLPDFLLGDWASTTSRGMIVAATGLGKTNLCLALSFAMT